MAAFDESKHPRVPAGLPGAGRFIAKSFSSDEEVADDLLSLMEKAEENGVTEFGLRVEDLDSPGRVGDALSNSRIWADGEPTDGFVNGTSTFGISGASRSGLQRALQAMGLTGGSKTGYFGKVIYLVGGRSSQPGEDVGESIIRRAAIIAVYTRDDDAFASIRRRIG